MEILTKVISKMEVHLENSFLPIQKERFLKLISRDSKILVWLRNEHPLLHTPTSKIHKDSENQLWSRGNEIYRSGILRVRSTDMERRKVYPPSINMSLNKRCWNTFTIPRMIWERKVGGKESLQRHLRPHFWGVKTQMMNWGLSLNDLIEHS